MSVADLCPIYGEAADWCSEVRRRARTPHRCYECGGTVAPGEQYMRSASSYGGGIETHRTCSRCLAVLDYVRAHVPCVQYLTGTMLDDLTAFTREARYEPDYAPGLHFGTLRRALAAWRAAP